MLPITATRDPFCGRHSRVLGSMRTIRAAALFISAICALHAGPARSQQLPSMKMGRAQLVSPAAADAYFAASTCHTYSMIDPAVCRTDAPPGFVRHIDVRTAARALGAGGITPDQYVNAVYEFILNGVDTEFRYGVAKGALGALLDRAGTPFDQAHLMVELLAEGGISASYKLGTITLNNTQFASWTTITDAKAACRFLANGGIPAAINGSTSAGCSYTGAVSSVTLSHIWVEAAIAGVPFVFDPSYKAYARTKLLDLSATAGYSRATFLANALNGATQSTINGSPAVHHLNRASIEASLNSMSQTALATIRQNHNQATLEELLGVPKLVRSGLIDTGPRQASLPYSSSVSRTVTLHLPDAYRTSLTLSGIENVLNRRLFIDEIYGERVEIAPIDIQTDTDVQLLVGDTVVQTVPLANYPTGFFGPWEQISYAFRLNLSIDHPYADQSGAYMDQFVSKQTKLHTATAVVFGAGNRRSGISSRWQQELMRDRHLPTYSPGDAVVGGQATHDKTKLLETGDWLQQFAMSLETLAGVSDTLIQHHHSIGVAYSDVTIVGGTDGGSGPPVFGYVADHALRTNLSSGISVAHRSGVDADAVAAERAAAALASTLEGSVAEQNSGSAEAASTHTRFVWGAQFTPNESVVLVPALADINSYASYIREVNCPTFTTNGELRVIQAYLSAGYNVLVHQNLCLGPGTYEDSSQPITVHQKSIARGASFVAFKPDYSEIAHVQANGHFIMKGAGSALTTTQFAPSQAADLLRDDFKSRDTHGVDLSSGALSYVPPADITTGTGVFPYSLSLQRSFKAGTVPSGSLGEGWIHNFSAEATMGSSGTEALGKRLPAAVAASAAAIYVTFDLFRDAPGVANMTVPSFVSHWWHQQLVGNVVTISQGTSSRMFVRLADGSWAPPPDDFGSLSLTGARRIASPGSYGCPSSGTDWNNTSRIPLVWDYSQLGISVTGRHGDVQTYSHWCIKGNGNLESPRSGFRLTNWTFPSGLAINFSYSSANGTLQQVSNSLGRSLTFTHTGIWSNDKEYLVSLQQVQDDAGRMVSFGYDQARVLTSVTLPDTRQWIYTYLYVGFSGPPAGYPADQRPMDFRQLYQVFEPISGTLPALQLAYDGIWSVKSLSDAVAIQAGSRGPWTYLITPNHLGEQVSPLGTTYRVYNDDEGRPIVFVNELGKQTLLRYNNRGLVVRRELPEKNSVEFSYDSRGNTIERRQRPKPGSSLPDAVASTVFPSSCSASLVTCNKPTSSTDARNQTTNYTWDGVTGMLRRVQGPADPSGQRSQVDYCYSSFGAGQRLLTGRVDKVDASRGRVQSYSYDSLDKFVPLSTTIDPAASLDANCNAVSKPSALNLVTTFDHDSRGDVISIDGPRTDVTDVVSQSFDVMRRMTRTQIDTAITRMEYDANGRLLKERKARVVSPNESTIVEAQWQTETRGYSATGQVTSVTDAEGHTTAFAHDALDRLVLTTDAENRRSSTVYDAAGRKSCEWRGWNSATPAAGCVWNAATYEATYSGRYRYSSYAYTDSDKELSVTDANNNTTEYQHDGLDRLQFTYFPDPATGNRCARAANDAASPACSGQQTYEKYTYDLAGNMLSTRTRKGETISRAYDGLSRLWTKSAQGLPVVTSTYTLLGEPLSLTSPAGAGLPAHAVGYDYDAAGRKLYEDNLVGGQTLRASYDYDRAGNRSHTIWNDGYFVHYQYDSLNRMKYAREQSTSANEMAFYDYDPLSRRQLLRYAGSSSNQVGYTYEPDGDLDVLTHALSGSAAVVLNYGYDSSRKIRQISANDDFYLPSPATGATAYVRNRLNQYDSIGDDSATYDANGNLTAWGPAADRRAYTYDSENRLRTASLNGSLIASYDYDPLGRRISKVANGAGTFYQPDGDEEIAEYGAAGSSLGALLRRYVAGPAIDDRIARVEVAGSEAGKHFYRVNHQGSVILTTNETGAVRQQLAYDEHGVLTSQQPPASTTGEQFRYTGRRYDRETGLYYYRARYYSAESGRFLQADPIGYRDDVNLYAYAGNDPLNHTDPTGAIADTLVDIGFIAYDIYELATNPSLTNAGALGADIVGAAVPFATGLGAVVRGVDKGADVARGADRAAKTEKHHVVPQADRRAEAARDNMRANGIDPKTEKTNLVDLPGDKHDVTKRDSYVRDVNDRVASQPDAASINEECCKIADELRNSTIDYLHEKYPRK